MHKSLYIVTLLCGLLLAGCDSTNSTTQFKVALSASPAKGGSVSPGNGQHEEGSTLEITAMANEGWRFVEWTGAYSGTNSTATITIDGDKNIEAIFTRKSYALTVTTDGEGTVSEELVQQKATDYEYGSIVKLTAEPTNGWEFMEWQGDVTGQDNPVQITVDDPKQVTAVFQKKTYALTVNTTGQGSVTKDPDQQEYDHGTTVDLTASPASGWAFEKWEGDRTGTDNPIQITVDEPKDVTAVFVEQSQNLFYLAENGVTIKCPEAAVGDSGTVNGIMYTKRSADQIYPNNANEVSATTCTSDIRNMSKLFYRATDFNADISSWDVSSVREMSRMFDLAHDFDADLSSWDVSHVTDMSKMFYQAFAFRGDISSWDVSSVTNMYQMFAHASVFNGDLSSWDVSRVNNMASMFYEAKDFNGDISNWDVSSVTTLRSTFWKAEAFNADLNSWDVGNVTTIETAFAGATAFNSDLNDWDVGNVTHMSAAFSDATAFNGAIGNWDVSNVIKMNGMFSSAESFNRDIGSWDVSNVNDMGLMFQNATAFNIDLGKWDVSNVTDMDSMFKKASSFNGYINNWDVSLVGYMDEMFYGASVFNQNLSGWCVSQFENIKPSGFSLRSALIPDNLPVWGSCPGGT